MHLSNCYFQLLIIVSFFSLIHYFSIDCSQSSICQLNGYLAQELNKSSNRSSPDHNTNNNDLEVNIDNDGFNSDNTF